MYQGNEEHVRNDTLREDVFRRVHASGLPVYFCPRPGFKKRYTCFATDFGSIDSSFSKNGGSTLIVPDGVAHFLEHKLFEEEDGVNASDKFSARGASANAYTSFTTTNYLFSCHDHYYENLRTLMDFVTRPYFTDENVEKEKGIIGEEISMYDDSAGWIVYMNLLAAMYSEHPIRKSILGTKQTIAEITKETLYSCHETFYHPENMALFAVGDLNREEFYRFVDEKLSGRKTEPQGAIGRVRPQEPQAVGKTHTSAELVVSAPRFLLGFKDQDVGYTGRRLLEREQLTDLVLEIVFGKSSSLFESLYKGQLIDEGFGAHYSAMVEVGFSVVGGETPDPARLEARIREEVASLRSRGIAIEDFERQRRAAMGSLLRQFNSLEFIANYYSSYRFMGVDLFDVIDVLHGLTLEQAQARLREHLDPDAICVSTILPKRTA